LVGGGGKGDATDVAAECKPSAQRDSARAGGVLDKFPHDLLAVGGVGGCAKCAVAAEGNAEMVAQTGVGSNSGGIGQCYWRKGKRQVGNGYFAAAVKWSVAAGCAFIGGKFSAFKCAVGVVADT
jgi:hypothetical protein